MSFRLSSTLSVHHALKEATANPTSARQDKFLINRLGFFFFFFIVALSTDEIAGLKAMFSPDVCVPIQLFVHTVFLSRLLSRPVRATIVDDLWGPIHHSERAEVGRTVICTVNDGAKGILFYRELRVSSTPL